MSELSRLEPGVVWEIFDEITKVPRPSKREGKIIAYLEDFARKHGLRHKKDATGNVVIYKEATPSMKGRPAVVLQSHMDMVCEKNSSVEFDFEHDPIQAYVGDGWVKARGTTLGADDGIGMAAQLAVLITDGIEHPDIEALFTVDEETGLTGAFNLGSDMLTGKYLLNLDSEDEGEIFIGCAGGIDTVATFSYYKQETPAGLKWMQARISGLKGGHSGDNINDGLGNSNKLLTRLLLEGSRNFGLRLSAFDGGNLRNAIPREAYAIFGVDGDKATGFTKFADALAADIKEEYKYTDPGVSLTVCELAEDPSSTSAPETAKPSAGNPNYVIDAATQERLLLSIQGVANGVMAMSHSMSGLVETSTNLASVKFKESNINAAGKGGSAPHPADAGAVGKSKDGQTTGKDERSHASGKAQGAIEVVSSQRSSVESAKLDAASTVEAIFRLAGAEVAHSDGYPGWAPDPSSTLLGITEKSYMNLFGKMPVVRAIHAGLECGLFLERYPHLEMVSFGPTLRGVHSPDERLEISTVDKFWRLLLDILKNV